MGAWLVLLVGVAACASQSVERRERRHGATHPTSEARAAVQETPRAIEHAPPPALTPEPEPEPAAEHPAAPPACGPDASGRPWYARVYPAGGGSVLTLDHESGREVRPGRGRTIRHGRTVPITVSDDGCTVELETSATLRWIVRRDATTGAVVLEEWGRSGEPPEWQLTRATDID